jgi:hypothetical protein
MGDAVANALAGDTAAVLDQLDIANRIVTAVFGLSQDLRARWRRSARYSPTTSRRFAGIKPE